MLTQHIQAIAKIIANEVKSNDEEEECAYTEGMEYQLDDIMRRLSDYFKTVNEVFNQNTFFSDCGMGDDKVEEDEEDEE